MKAVIQRVSQATVDVAGERIASIAGGALVLLGVTHGDTERDAVYLAQKTARLRIFDDAEGRMNESIQTVGGDMLVVSQFTLYGECRKGNRPSYIQAAPSGPARTLYEQYVAALRAENIHVETGRFQTEMAVSLVNDGPVTLILECSGR